MIYLNTKIKRLGRAPTVRIADMALRWCRRELGVNNRKKYQPIWSVRMGYDEDCGEYDAEDNEVFVYWDNCEDVRELIGTCIHEWTHQLQPIRTKYYKYPGSYSRNPYERAARYAEKKHTPACWAHIRKHIKRNKWNLQYKN